MATEARGELRSGPISTKLLGGRRTATVAVPRAVGGRR